MITIIGPKGCVFSHQDEFPEKTACVCGAEGRIAFVAYEGSKEESYVRDLHESTEARGLWPHDVIAVAVYLCKKCLKPTAIFNQG